jgi:SSS family solute:Na+ symporter
MQPTLSTLDIAIVLAFFALVVCVGMYISRKHSGGAEDYFLAGRSMSWPLIGGALFASNISSTTLIGLSGDAYATGISVYNYEWFAAIVLIFFCIFMLPFVIKASIFTMPEYLERRYDGRVRLYFASLTLFLNIMVEMSGALYAGSLVVQMVFPSLSTFEIIAGLALLATAYTAVGGLSAVMVAEVMQAVVLIIGSIILSYIAFDKIGGIHVLFEQVPASKLSLIRPLDDEGVPWLGLVTGVPLLGFYFWCTNQFMVQRVLTAKSELDGRKGALLAGFLKLTVLFIMVLPGTAAIILYPNLERPDLVYPTLLFDLMPVGLLGLVFAGFMAALMSAIEATLSSASTMVTMDIVKRFKPNLSSKAQVKCGKLAIILIMMVAVAWAPNVAKFPSLFKYLQIVLAYAVPPSVTMFLFGAFWKRANSKGAFAVMVIGVLSGIGLFVSNEILHITNLHFLYVAPILVALCSVVMVVVSLAAKQPIPANIDEYVWSKEFFHAESALLKGVKWYDNYRIWSVILFIITVVIVGYFA